MRFKTGTTLVEFLRDAASDASSILAASTSRPEPKLRIRCLRFESAGHPLPGTIRKLGVYIP
jgi:hypothetical protein